ncbi:MAG: DUF488 domain-containing protein [Candidatus Bathyarchaeia archaeon]
MRVYTIGYSGRKITNFISALKERDVTIVIDVRRFPKSSEPAFNRENLEIALKENNIRYIFLGENLGGFVREGYEKYMETRKFKEGLTLLLNIIREGNAVLMCRERNVKYCHRRFISQILENLGIEVIHI